MSGVEGGKDRMGGCKTCVMSAQAEVAWDVMLHSMIESMVCSSGLRLLCHVELDCTLGVDCDLDIDLGLCTA